MDFDKAVAMHVDWKRKLRSYLKNPDYSLKAAEIAMDDKCELGEWIATKGTTSAHLPEYAALKSNHSHFHKVAADVVRRADSGQDVSEEVALGAESEFASASRAVVRSILNFVEKIGRTCLPDSSSGASLLR